MSISSSDPRSFIEQELYQHRQGSKTADKSTIFRHSSDHIYPSTPLTHPKPSSTEDDPLIHEASLTAQANAPNSEVTESPLHGVRVLDMTEALAGPYCGMMLGDLGADVIKVERRGIGDQSRRWGPPFVGDQSAYYLSINRNKRSLEIDLDETEDQEILHRLVETADVFLTNIPRMGSLRKRNVDPDQLMARRPELIFCAISGYGHTGPKAERPGYDVIAQGEAGLMALTGEPDGAPTRFPTPMADISAGIYSLIGILSALYSRDRPGGTGKGRFLDVSLVDSQVTWLANVGGSFLANGEAPQRLGNTHPTITPYQPVRARDRAFLVAVGTERLWQKFCDIFDWQNSVMVDPRFDTNSRRNANRSALIQLIEDRLADHDAEHWIRALLEAGVPAGPINLPEEALTDEHLIARGMIVELEHPALGWVRSIGFPVHMSVGGPTYRRHPPTLGEHNREILSQLGMG